MGKKSEHQSMAALTTITKTKYITNPVIINIGIESHIVDNDTDDDDDKKDNDDVYFI